MQLFQLKTKKKKSKKIKLPQRNVDLKRGRKFILPNQLTVDQYPEYVYELNDWLLNDLRDLARVNGCAHSGMIVYSY